MIDIYLRFDTEADAIEALPEYYDHEAGEWRDGDHRYALCVIGSIEKTPAVLDEDGEVITPAVIDTRWHANVRAMIDIPPELLARIESYFPNPENPRVRWS